MFKVTYGPIHSTNIYYDSQKAQLCMLKKSDHCEKHTQDLNNTEFAYEVR